MYDFYQYTGVVDIRNNKLQFDLRHTAQFYFNALQQTFFKESLRLYCKIAGKFYKWENKTSLINQGTRATIAMSSK